MTMTNELTGLATRISEAETEHDVVKTTLEQAEQVLTSDALHLLGFIIISTELLLEHSIDKLCFLFLFQLQTILRNLAVRTARLTLGLLGTTDDRWLEAEGTAAFQGRDSIYCHLV